MDRRSHVQAVGMKIVRVCQMPALFILLDISAERLEEAVEEVVGSYGEADGGSSFDSAYAKTLKSLV